MSNNYWEEEDEDQDNDIPLQGDDLVRKLRKAKRADEKRIKELTEQLEGLSKVQREKVVKEILEKKGVNPKAQRLILKDLDDVTEESVNNWLDDNGDLFGLTKPEITQEQELNRAALRQQDVITQLGATPDKAQDLMDRVMNAATAEELTALIHGN